VGRGALKLERALDLWPVAVDSRVVLDVGASTGGFTEVCLDRGAAQVFAVDVGTGQLHPKVAADPRVANLEKTDARDLTPDVITEAPSLIVCGVSFISLSKVLPTALDLATPGADLITLVKPQFELQPGQVGKGGIVRDASLYAQVEERLRAACEQLGLRVRAWLDSPIEGGDGNREFFIHADLRSAA